MHALIFDLDGTLVDTVYGHVLAWQRALSEAAIDVDGYRLHRHVGSSGKLIVRFAQRETGRQLAAEQVQTVLRRHGELSINSCHAPGRFRAPSKCFAS